MQIDNLKEIQKSMRLNSKELAAALRELQKGATTAVNAIRAFGFAIKALEQPHKKSLRLRTTKARKPYYRLYNSRY